MIDDGHGYHQLGFDDENHLYATGKTPVRRWARRSGHPDWGNAGPYVARILDAEGAITRSDIVEITPPRVWGKPRSTHGLAVTPQGTVYVGDPLSADPAVWRYRRGVWSAMLPYGIQDVASSILVSSTTESTLNRPDFPEFPSILVLGSIKPS